jgi:hypothetical protein
MLAMLLFTAEYINIWYMELVMFSALCHIYLIAAPEKFLSNWLVEKQKKKQKIEEKTHGCG